MNIDIDTDIDRDIYIYARLHRGPRLQATTIMSRLPALSAGICPVSERNVRSEIGEMPDPNFTRSILIIQTTTNMSMPICASQQPIQRFDSCATSRKHLQS